MEPLFVAVNLTPSSTPEIGSDASVTLGGATSGQMAQGHAPPASNDLLVVNACVYDPSMVWPF